MLSGTPANAAKKPVRPSEGAVEGGGAERQFRSKKVRAFSNKGHKQMSLFYTRRGDMGRSLVGGKRIDKTVCMMDVLGHLDELNSLLGLVRSQSEIRLQFKKALKAVQNNLFIVQANIAAIALGRKSEVLFSGFKIKELEIFIDTLENKVKPEREFVVSGATQSSAWFDYARAVCRRAEREVLKLAKKKKIPTGIQAYLNRLSSLFFAIARYEAKAANKKESHPSYNSL